MNTGRSRSLGVDLLVAIALLAVMSIVATLGFRGVFPTWSFLPASIVGGLGAAALTVASRRLALSVAESLLVSLVAFVILGTVAVGGLPTLAALEAFFDGLINGWAQVLSSTPPADITAEFKVLPFSIAWLGMMIGGELLRSTRTPGLAALGPVVALVVSMLVTLENRTVAIAQGVVMALGALALGFAQQRQRMAAVEAFDDVTIEAPKRRHGLLPALGVLTLIGVAAPVLAPRMPFASANDRFDLREFQTPPYDPLRQPTPLVQLKAALQEANADIAVFRVTSDTPLDRFPLAVLDDYNGEFWAVADQDGEVGGRFRPVDSLFPEPDGATIDGWERTTATIEMLGLNEIARGEFDPDWLPLAGWPVSIDSDAELDLRFDSNSGTLAVAPDGADSGLVFDVVVAVPPEVESVSLRQATVTRDEPTNLALPQLTSFAGDVLEGADVGWEQIEAIRTALVDGGAYDSRDGSETARSGHSLGRLRDFLNDPERIAGFEEQYAATAALLARSEGLPARVVVGFSIPPDEVADRWSGGSLDVLAEDMSAWIEVRFDGIGWLPFDVTPPRDRLPEDITAGRSQREVAVPNPPPDPPPPVLPPELDRDTEVEEEDEIEEQEDEEDTASGGLPLGAIALGLGIATPVILLIASAMTVILLKRRRTARRRHAASPSRRVSGAWYETIDRYAELGAKPRPVATPTEFARGLGESEILTPGQRDVLLGLADDVTTAAFHPRPPSEEVAEQAWQKSDFLTTQLSSHLSPVGRLKQKVDPRPLLRKDPLAESETTDD